MTLPELLTAARDDCAALTPSARVSFRRVAILENAPGGGWDERNLLLATESNSLVIFTRASQMFAGQEVDELNWGDDIDAPTCSSQYGLCE